MLWLLSVFVFGIAVGALTGSLWWAIPILLVSAWLEARRKSITIHIKIDD